MRLQCEVAVQKCSANSRVRPLKGLVAIGKAKPSNAGSTNENQVATSVLLTVSTQKDTLPKHFKVNSFNLFQILTSKLTRKISFFQMTNNIETIYDNFVKAGRLTIRLKDGVDVLINKVYSIFS